MVVTNYVSGGDASERQMDQNMPRGLHWSHWQDAGAPTQGAQEGLNIRQSVTIGRVPYNEMGGSRGGGPSSTLTAEMCCRSMLHRIPSSLFRWLVSLWIIQDMRRHHLEVYEQVSITQASVQLTGWPVE